MAKKIKFPLEMADGVKVRTLEDLQQNFNLEKVLGYYFDGKLQQWLADRYYKKELNEIEELSVDDQQIAEKLCSILGVQYEADAIDTVKDIAWRNERLAKLKQYTDDENFLANIDAVAFNQEELADLFDADIEKIYLCEGKFHVPEEKMNLEYIEFGGAEIVNKPKQDKLDEKKFEMAIRYEKCDAEDDNFMFREGKYSFLHDIDERNFIDPAEEPFLTIYLKSKDGNKVQITDEDESVTCFIYDNERIIYSTAIDGLWDYKTSDYIYEIKKDGTKQKISDMRFDDEVRFIHLDSEKVVWACSKDNTFGFEPPLYVRYFDEIDSRVILEKTNKRGYSPRFDTIMNSSKWAIYGDYFYYIGTNDNNQLWKINMKTGEIIEGGKYSFFKILGDKIYARGARKNENGYYHGYIFEINMKTLEERELCSTGDCSDYYFCARDVQHEENNLFWVEKKFGDGRIYSYDLVTGQKNLLVEVKDLGSPSTAHFLVKEGWIYFGAIGYDAEYGSRMIKTDGTKMKNIKSINEYLFENQPQKNFTVLDDLKKMKITDNDWSIKRKIIF